MNMSLRITMAGAHFRRRTKKKKPGARIQFPRRQAKQVYSLFMRYYHKSIQIHLQIHFLQKGLHQYQQLLDLLRQITDINLTLMRHGGLLASTPTPKKGKTS